MRPEPPADFKPSLFERIGLTRFFSPTFRMALRNIERRPGMANLDLGIQKNFAMPFREGMALQFRAEAFNAFNRTNLGNPGVNRSAAGFGQIRSTFPARQVQFALRLQF